MLSSCEEAALAVAVRRRWKFICQEVKHLKLLSSLTYFTPRIF